MAFGTCSKELESPIMLSLDGVDGTTTHIWFSSQGNVYDFPVFGWQ